MSTMETKSDSVANESEDIMTSTSTEREDTLNGTPTGTAVGIEYDTAALTVSNDKVSPTTEMKTDEGDGMNC